MNPFSSLLLRILPYLISAALAAGLAFSVRHSNKLKTERDNYKHLSELKDDSLGRANNELITVRTELLKLQVRDAEIQMAYVQTMSRFGSKLDSMKRATANESYAMQRQLIRQRTQAIPVPEWHPLNPPVVGSVTMSQFRLTCYDSVGIARIVEATTERDAYKQNDSLQTRAYTQLWRSFSDYKQDMTLIADLPWYRSKAKAIRRRNGWAVLPSENPP